MEYSCNTKFLHAKATGPVSNKYCPVLLTDLFHPQGYSGATPPLNTVTILGVRGKPSKVTLESMVMLMPALSTMKIYSELMI